MPEISFVNTICAYIYISLEIIFFIFFLYGVESEGEMVTL